MNLKFINNVRNFHYYSTNLILRTELINNLGLNYTLFGFKKNNNNYIDTLNKNDMFLIDNKVKINKNFNKIIDVYKPKIIHPPKNFIWFYKNSFYLQFYNEYQRDIYSNLFMIDP